MPDANRATVLVVEDEVLIRLDLISYLENQDVRVREAGSADEALIILMEDISIRGLFTDLRMPGSMDGLALAREVRSRWPNVYIVICSGNELPAGDQVAFDRLDKPYVQQDVAEIITKLNVWLLSQASGEAIEPAIATAQVGDGTT